MRPVLIVSLLLGACTPGALDVLKAKPPDPPDLTAQLVAYWPLDRNEQPVADVRDHSGNGRNGTVIGGRWLSPNPNGVLGPDGGVGGAVGAGGAIGAGGASGGAGTSGAELFGSYGKFGGALELNPPTDEVAVMGFPPAKPDFSVSLWVRFAVIEPFNNGEQYLTIISTEVANKGGWEVNLTADFTIQFAYYVCTPVAGDQCMRYEHYESPKVSPDSWIHMVAVLDGTNKTLSFYLNGILETMPPKTVSQLITSLDNTVLYLGRWYQQGRRLRGDFDDIAIYNRVLGPDDVAALYSHPAM